MESTEVRCYLREKGIGAKRVGEKAKNTWNTGLAGLKLGGQGYREARLRGMYSDLSEQKKTLSVPQKGKRAKGSPRKEESRRPRPEKSV